MNLKTTLKDNGLILSSQYLHLLRDRKESVAIPSKTLHFLYHSRKVSQKLLKEIHTNKDIAIELCLLTLSNLANTYSRSFNSDDKKVKQGWKRLYSQILSSQVDIDGERSSKYRVILDLLVGAGVIEEESSYTVGKSRMFRLTHTFYGKGIVNYRLKDKTVRKMKIKDFNQNFERAIKTELGKNSIRMRSKVQFPTDEEAELIVSDAVKDKYPNKKGKRLVWLGKNSKKTYPESDYVYAEDYLERYKYLRDQLVVPVVAEELADFRVIDCFNLMPSLFRKHLKVGGETFVEADFTCLHPNIAQAYYGGTNTEMISHEKVAVYLEIDRQEAKIEHLSFFNKRYEDMKKSPLWNYYVNNETKMMENIIKEKAESLDAHKATSRTLFKIETNIMEEIVKRLSKQGMDVLYVFDALYCHKADRNDVKQVMNEVAKEFKVKSMVCSKC